MLHQATSNLMRSVMNRRKFLYLGGCTTLAGILEPTTASAASPLRTIQACSVKHGRLLVIYFSRSGNTRYIAETLAKGVAGSHLAEIKASKPYAPNYSDCCDEALPECRSKTLRPIIPIKLDLSKFDVILIGTPNWWGTLAPPVRTWVHENATALQTKTIGFFQTHGGGGIQQCERDLQALLPKATYLPTQCYYGSTVKSNRDLKRFVAKHLVERSL